MATHSPKLKPPGHFDDDQKAAWDDLLKNAGTEFDKPEFFFTLEIAATLMAKLRKGMRPLSATEMKELKKYLVMFGLAKGDGEGGGSSKPKKNAKYFGRQG